MKNCVTVLTVYVLVLYGVHAAPPYLRTSTGGVVAVKNLRKWFPHDNVQSLSSRIFELSPSGLLDGRGRVISHLETDSTFQVTLGSETTVVIDGKVRSDIRPSVVVYRGRELLYATLPDGTPILAHIAGLRLAPIDIQKHPGVFVNHGSVGAANETDKVDLTEDEIPMPSGSTSRIQESDLNLISTRQSSCASLMPKREVELAIDFDSTYCSQNGGQTNAVASITALMADVQIPYSQDTCVEFNLVRIRGFCNAAADPYATAIAGYDSVTILNTFRDYWNSNEGATQRDLAHLISGFQRTNSAKGIAYVGAACSLSFAYGWSEPLRTIVAHELGHNLDATHTTEGIMVAVGDGTQAYAFSQVSINEITSYVDSSSGSCLATLSSGSEPSSSQSPTSSPAAPNPPLPSVSPSPTPSSESAGNGKSKRSSKPRPN